MRGSEIDLRRTALIMGLQEAGGAKAPMISGLEASKSEFRARARKIVANVFRKGKKFGGHDRTNRVASLVFGAGVAVPIPEEAGHGFLRASFKPFAQYIDRFIFFQHLSVLS